MFAHKGCGFEWVRVALRDLLPPLPLPCLLPVLAPLTWPHRLHQHDAVPTDSEAKAMLVLLDDDAALDQTWGGRGGRISEPGGQAWLVGSPCHSVPGAVACVSSPEPELGAEPLESATLLPDPKSMANSSSLYKPLVPRPHLDPFSRKQGAPARAGWEEPLSAGRASSLAPLGCFTSSRGRVPPSPGTCSLGWVTLGAAEGHRRPVPKGAARTEAGGNVPPSSLNGQGTKYSPQTPREAEEGVGKPTCSFGGV